MLEILSLLKLIVLSYMGNIITANDLATEGADSPGIDLIISEYSCRPQSLHWRHNDHDGVSNHQPHGCLLNRLFRRRSKKISKLRVTGLCEGSSPGPVNSPHKWPVTRKMFPFDDVIMDPSLCAVIAVFGGLSERGYFVFTYQICILNQRVEWLS